MLLPAGARRRQDSGRSGAREASGGTGEVWLMLAHDSKPSNVVATAGPDGPMGTNFGTTWAVQPSLGQWPHGRSSQIRSVGLVGCSRAVIAR